MDKAKLAEALGVESHGGFHISGFQLSNWGNNLILTGEYIGEPAIPFQIRLEDCRELQWRVYAHAAAQPSAALVNLRLGTDQHRKPLVMLTDAFGLTVLYGQITLVRA